MNRYFLSSNLHKAKLEIERNGSTYTVERLEKDKYGEPKGVEEVLDIKGLFHVSEGYETRSISDGTTTQGKEMPMLLTLYEDSREIKIGDRINIDGVTYIVAAFNDIQMYHIIVDISLEVVIDGR